VRYGFVVAGYVLMPEHVHLLVGEPRRSSLSIALQVLKQQTSRKLKQRGEVQFWQRRYYDFNVWSEEKRVEKLRYMHRNPVTRDLAEASRAAPNERAGLASSYPTHSPEKGRMDGARGLLAWSVASQAAQANFEISMPSL
jgi:hypothetical protein